MSQPGGIDGGAPLLRSIPIMHPLSDSGSEEHTSINI